MYLASGVRSIVPMLPLAVSRVIFICGAADPLRIARNLLIPKATTPRVIRIAANARAAPRRCLLISLIRYSALVVGWAETTSPVSRGDLLTSRTFDEGSPPPLGIGCAADPKS